MASVEVVQKLTDAAFAGDLAAVDAILATGVSVNAQDKVRGLRRIGAAQDA